MGDKALCRIGVFYDGSYFTYAQDYFYHQRQLGWLSFNPFHTLLENFVREKEQGSTAFKIVHAGWYQGVFPLSQSTEQQLKNERKRYYELIYAGIEPKFEPMSPNREEKGVDVAMAVDALQFGLEGKIDTAVLVTGDGDFVPLVRALVKLNIRVMTAYFEYEDEGYSHSISKRLRNACNYALDITALEKDQHYQATFRGLFRQQDKQNGLDAMEAPRC